MSLLGKQLKVITGKPQCSCGKCTGEWLYEIVDHQFFLGKDWIRVSISRGKKESFLGYFDPWTWFEKPSVE